MYLNRIQFELCRYYCLALASPDWTRTAQHLVSVVLCVFGLVLAALATVLFNILKSPNALFLIEVCSAPTTNYSFILNDYLGYKKIYNDGIVLQAIGILVKQLELVIYILMFRQFYFRFSAKLTLLIRSTYSVSYWEFSWPSLT